ncbi:MAG: hypothetical protein HZB51_21880 [Chloroflexi bacterium]|nr:hypothetical protein [Chloroflexota bacterium]
MTETAVQSDRNQSLNQIREGMRVLDRDGHDIGMVDRVYLGAAGDQAYERGEGPATTSGDPTLETPPVIPDIAHLFEPDNLPEELRERLLNRGFVRINASGILAADRYLLPDQIDHIEKDQVRLNVLRKELIKA